ncbi:hypothetical protein F4802DRAFT_262228 [Xylaria palmicola]|nr:hypothetical protein F4802DRAFT_262228 [Xylaria palmicola]
MWLKLLPVVSTSANSTLSLDTMNCAHNTERSSRIWGVLFCTVTRIYRRRKVCEEIEIYQSRGNCIVSTPRRSSRTWGAGT